MLALGEQVICIDDVSLHCGSSFNASQLSSPEVEITLETQRDRESTSKMVLFGSLRLREGVLENFDR